MPESWGSGRPRGGLEEGKNRRLLYMKGHEYSLSEGRFQREQELWLAPPSRVGEILLLCLVLLGTVMAGKV